MDVVLSGRIVTDDGKDPSWPCTKTLVQQTDGSFKEDPARRIGFECPSRPGNSELSGRHDV